MDQELESFVSLLNKNRTARPPAGELSHLPNWAQRALAKLPEPTPPRRSLPTNGAALDSKLKSDIAVPPAAIATPPISVTEPAPPATLIILDDAPAAPTIVAAPPTAEIAPPPEIKTMAPPADIAAAKPATLVPTDLTPETREKIDAIPALADMFAGPLAFDAPAQFSPANPLPSPEFVAPQDVMPVALETRAALPEPVTEPDFGDIAALLPAMAAPSSVPDDLGTAVLPAADSAAPADDNVVPMPARRRPLAYAVAAAAVIAVVALVMGGYWYARQPGFAFIANALRPDKATTAPTPPMVAAKTVPSPNRSVPPDGVSASGNAAIAPVADATPQSTVADATPQSIAPPAPVMRDPPRSATAKSAPATAEPAPTASTKAPPVTVAAATPAPAKPDNHTMVAATPAVTPVAAKPTVARKPDAVPDAGKGAVETKLAALPKADAKPAPPVVKAPILAAAPAVPVKPMIAEKAPIVPAAPLAVAALPVVAPKLDVKADMPVSPPTVAVKSPPVGESPAAQIAMLMPPALPVIVKPRGEAAPTPAAAPPASTADEPTWLRNAVPAPPFTGQPQIAIVIDDLGLDRDRTRRAIALSGPVTLSFLAYASELPRQTEAARQAGHELIVHIPMEPIVRPKLVSQNTGGVVHDELLRRLRWDLGRFTGYVGVNNHMGNRLTTDPESIKAVIGELKARGLLFLDSGGGAGGAVSVAQRLGVPTVSRDIFLDDDVSAVAIKARLADLEKVARQSGTAIAIGHPHDQTLDVLTAWLASLPSKGLQLVPLTAIVRDREQHVAGAN